MGSSAPTGHWFDSYQHVYQAIEHAAQFMQTLELTQLDMDSLADGVHIHAELVPARPTLPQVHLPCTGSQARPRCCKY